MDQLQLETEVPASHEVNSVDSSLRLLWEKIRSVVELVNQLKMENASIIERNEQLAADLQRTKTQFENQLTSLHNQYDREVTALKGQNETDVSSIKKFYENELSKLRSSAETELTSTRTTLETTLREVKGQLETELNTARNQASVRDQELKRVRAEYSQIVNANENVAFTKEEKDILRNRIRELIAKINSHL